ncbi:MAG TPA: alkaline phosphatase D family protein [Oligoflexus sp.]|uniref:alkaline phosphatase D family protein n=1 Tax=Oligoflexus sp. TaxID=1971216 RepID=UPI002D55BFDD|nr:alkaline phosphatase D family protein [Oligoflexus sp.]HYX38396.1 alkaline phosphatase D family protein [Oligoflexus sp.]
MESKNNRINRRQMLKTSLMVGTGFVGASSLWDEGALGMPKRSTFRQSWGRPLVPWGVQLGDITPHGLTLWSASDQPAEMLVEVADNIAFQRAMRFSSGMALDAQDYTTRVNIQGLPSADLLHYRVTFRSLHSAFTSEPFEGTIRPLAANPSRLRFCFSGDTAGQGWGINPEFGGMRLYDAILRRQPDFFVHCGDCIYADGPMTSEVVLDDGRVWKNVVTEAKSKVAESLQEYRGNYQYNLLDENVRKFNAQIPQIVQWDDHETVNNWYPQELLDDSRYTEKSLAVLSSRAQQAFLEYAPINPLWAGQKQIYRSFSYGSLLELFLIDLRSYRGPNSPNRQTNQSPETDFMGLTQLEWLKRSLAASQATWKVISSDMPLGLVVPDGPSDQEGWANGDGPAMGRELELAELLQFIMEQNIRNVVWITADVHYAAAHHYQPAKAQFKNFKPFWEFVSGPLHAGTFGPNTLDNTFGPEVKWKGIPDGLKANRSPLDGYQFFGEIEVNAETGKMMVKQFNGRSEEVFSMELEAEQ